MGWGATNEEPDIAEMSGNERRLPTWSSRVVIGVLLAVVLVALYLVRQTEPGLEVVADPPRYSERHVTETDVRIDNPTDDSVYVDIEPPQRSGLRLRDILAASLTTHVSSPTYLVQPGEETTLTLRWQPTDCTAATTEYQIDKPAMLTLLVGGLVGEKNEVRVRLGSWRELVPPACDDFPGRGVPRLADDPATASSEGLVASQMLVDNMGGQPLRLVDATVSEGVDPDLIVDVRPRLATLDIGGRLEVLVRFRQNDCRAPEDAPAVLLLRFDTMTTAREETLEVRLADSWANLIGSCVPSAG